MITDERNDRNDVLRDGDEYFDELAGDRGLNRAVGEVLGYTVRRPGGTFYHLFPPGGAVGITLPLDTEAEAWAAVPRFSTSLDAAWEGMAWLREHGDRAVSVVSYAGGWCVKHRQLDGWHTPPCEYAEHAICAAVLLVNEMRAV